MENITQDTTITTQKKSRGRPKNGFNKLEYIKKYNQEHKEERKEYAQNYRQNISENNPMVKENILKSNKRYKDSLKYALDLIKLMNQNGDINDKYKDFLSKILI